MSDKKPVKKFTFGFPSKKTVANNAGTGSQVSNESVKRKLESKDDDHHHHDSQEAAQRKHTRPALVDIDDKDELLESALGTSSIGASSTAKGHNGDDDGEDDPLDAFMADMTEKAKEKKTESKIRRDDIEEEDDLESYMRQMEKKGVAVGQGGAVLEHDENANSDDEVYATAAAIDAAQQYDASDVASGGKREIEPLSRVKHDEIDYLEIEKCFYEEHPDISALTSEQVRSIRKDLNVYVRGSDVAKPCVSFGHFGFDDDLMRVIIKAGYSEPTAIQKQAIPVALQGRDIIGIAKTGSGKTAAFVLPMLVHIMDQDELVKGDGPIGLILAPTHELAGQIYTETKKFAKAYGLRVAAVYGGASKLQQFKELRSGTVEIIVATPGRFIDMIKMKATNLRRVSYLVLDEADRMFDLGFEPQVRSICDNVRPDRQTLLFSATFRKHVENLAREATSNSVRINVGHTGQANEDITQEIVILEDELQKWDWLMQRLPVLCIEGSVIIFVSRRGAVDVLASNVQEAGFDCVALHGDLQQFERDKVIKDFRNDKASVLVATDVAARGLDIKTVRSVVNYDHARDMDSHVHRIGRTGRAGEKGTAYTLITQKDDRFASDLVRHLEVSGQAVSDELLQLAMRNPRFSKSRFGLGHPRGRGMGRGRGQGRGHGRERGRGLGHRGQAASGANLEPLGQRGGLSHFQKASSSAAGAHGLSTVPSTTHHHNPPRD